MPPDLRRRMHSETLFSSAELQGRREQTTECQVLQIFQTRHSVTYHSVSRSVRRTAKQRRRIFIAFGRGAETSGLEVTGRIMKRRCVKLSRTAVSSCAYRDRSRRTVPHAVSVGLARSVFAQRGSGRRIAILHQAGGRGGFRFIGCHHHLPYSAACLRVRISTRPGRRRPETDTDVNSSNENVSVNIE